MNDCFCFLPFPWDFTTLQHFTDYKRRGTKQFCNPFDSFLLPLFKRLSPSVSKQQLSVLSPDYTLPFKCIPLPPHLFILLSSPQGFCFLFLFFFSFVSILKDFRYKHSTTKSVMRNLAKSMCTDFSKKLSFLVNHKIIFHPEVLNSICYLLVPLNLFPGIWLISFCFVVRSHEYWVVSTPVTIESVITPLAIMTQAEPS